MTVNRAAHRQHGRATAFTRGSRLAAIGAALAMTATLAACGGGGTAGGSSAATTASAMSATARLGEKLFVDTSLSLSGRQSCASCHDAAFGRAAPNSLAVQLGGADLTLQGSRAAPSADYLAFNTAFYFAADGTPTGGFFWDGRAQSLAEQAAGPFLNPVEMAMPSKAAVVAAVAKASYAEDFKAVFGATIFSNPELAYDRITYAIQAYEREDGDFRAFTSKYDAFLAGKTTLTAAEQRGLALFNNPAKGNCFACHPSAKGADGASPLFTDFSYDALGVPRNDEIAANADPAHYDLGLCARPDGSLAHRTDLCGAFKVPSLRNVALRGALFHNGRFKSLTEAIRFYVTRDTDPAAWYPTVDGVVVKFNDLPAEYRRNVNTTEAPYNRKPGDAPALTEAEIADVVAFLGTLTDGWSAAR
ncbi:cytochrome-c peroxidase [Derxia gummosa]|uniref:Cytochrome-c peroxidase n=1 Tax=Derxia gummosa DSM 723 TaxID=1121388 RepID=A0A8B6XBP4_9BURK|nr:cytochrome c peroxidase [Derxia gummosa]